MDLSRHDYPFYLYRDDRRALQWLETNASRDDIVLSSYAIGHYVPGLTGTRPFLSNAVMTMDSDRKAAMVQAFFDSNTSDEQRQALLIRYGIRYLFYGPAERALGSFNPDESELFERVFTSTHTWVYEVLV